MSRCTDGPTFQGQGMCSLRPTRCRRPRPSSLHAVPACDTRASLPAYRVLPASDACSTGVDVRHPRAHGVSSPRAGRKGERRAHHGRAATASPRSREGVLQLVRWFIACVALAWVPTQAWAEPRLPDVVEEITPSVVGVGTFDRLRSPAAQLLGTGFVVGDGRTIITNAHVVGRPLSRTSNETYVIFIGRGEQARSEPVEVLERNDEHDLAVLRFETGPALPPFRFAEPQRARAGLTIAFTGFPIGAVLGLYPVTHTGIIAGISPVAIPRGSARELTAEQIRLRRGAWNIFQLDAVAYPGNSGSPLYDAATGDLLGVINMVLVKRNRESALSDPSGISYAIPAAQIIRLLDQLRLSH